MTCQVSLMLACSRRKSMGRLTALPFAFRRGLSAVSKTVECPPIQVALALPLANHCRQGLPRNRVDFTGLFLTSCFPIWVWESAGEASLFRGWACHRGANSGLQHRDDYLERE